MVNMKYKISYLDVKLGIYRYRHFDNDIALNAFYNDLANSIYVKDLKVFYFDRSSKNYKLKVV